MSRGDASKVGKRSRNARSERQPQQKANARVTAQKQEVRIIGGEHRGRKLRFPAGTMVRPTLDRVRETLFNWLMHDIHAANVVDLFAGSGVLGIEALSRGAASASFVENDKRLIDSLKRNLDMLHLPVNAKVAKVHTVDVASWLATKQPLTSSTSTDSLQPNQVAGLNHRDSGNGNDTAADIVFMDPPFDLFDATAIDAICRQLAAKVLAIDGLLYLEQPKGRSIDALSQAPWVQLKHKTSGNVDYGLWQLRDRYSQ